jgi:O-antigen/teichoic acid export membrane protein
MSVVKRIVKNTGFLLLGRILTKVISLFSVIFIVRYLGDIGYGKYAFAFAFVSFFTIISEFGMHSILVREVSRFPAKAPQLLGNAMLISAFFSLIAFVLAILSVNLFKYPEETVMLVKIASLILIFGMMYPFGVIYETELKMKYSVFFGLISRVFLIFSILYVTKNDYGLNWLVLVTVMSDGIHYFLMAIYSRKFVLPVFKYDWGICRFLLKESLPLAFSSVFLIIYFRIDVVMLSLMKGDADVGIYSSAYRITEAFIFIPSTLMVSVFPFMSKYYSGNNNTLYHVYLKSFKVLFTIALPLALAISYFSNEIIDILYGGAVQGASITLQILIWATAVIFINFSLGQFLVSVNKQRVTTASTAICALFNIILNYFMIPLWGYNGAAISTVATEVISLFIMLYYMNSSISVLKIINEIKYILFITSISFLLFLIFDLYFNVLLSFLVAILIYIYSMYSLGGLNMDDKLLVRKLFK